MKFISHSKEQFFMTEHQSLLIVANLVLHCYFGSSILPRFISLVPYFFLESHAQ